MKLGKAGNDSITINSSKSSGSPDLFSGDNIDNHSDKYLRLILKKYLKSSDL